MRVNMEINVLPMGAKVYSDDGNTIATIVLNKDGIIVGMLSHGTGFGKVYFDGLTNTIPYKDGYRITELQK